MNCKKCGEFCQCPMEPPSQSSVQDSPESEETSSSLLEPDASSGDLDSLAWRQELSARLHRYRLRRRVRPPRYPSLRLPLGNADSVLKSETLDDPRLQPAFESSQDQALALAVAEELQPSLPPSRSASPPEFAAQQPVAATHSGAKIIEFPRFGWAPSPPAPDQLAEPVMDRPRILEVPEVAPPPPALGGITIEPAKVEEPEKRPGIDIPLQRVPFGRRMLASLIDGAIVGAASVLYGFIFWKIALARPPQIQLIALAAVIPCSLWAAYQYLLIVYAGTTPGLRLARLQLSRFDGTPTRRSLRRWRVLASFLSAASLGMGYVWLFLDEDTLCWHDRITRTYLAPLKRDAKS